MIRKAIMKDVKPIQKLLEPYVQKGLLLPRSLSELYGYLRDYYVYIPDGEDDPKGTCALHLCWEDLAEIKSLAVDEAVSGQGIGSRLVETCVSEAITLGLYKIFALTYRVDFFKRLGFKEVDKSLLPHKIWADCLKCAKFPECDEIAVLLEV
ncbi:MAG: N-acetyltransferase [Thermodesulfobacteriota bacterium]